MKLARIVGLILIGIVLVPVAQRWFAVTENPLADGARADRVVIEKGAHTMTLYQQGIALKTYRVALGRGGAGPKTRAGDNKVPEGVYPIVGRNARSAFYLSLRLDYPNAQQARAARRRGIDPGGDVMIHGIRNGLGWIGNLQRRLDWTRGCIAVTDPEMDEVWRAVPNGTPVEIRP